MSPVLLNNPSGCGNLSHFVIVLLVHFFHPLKNIANYAMAFACQVFRRLLGYFNCVAMRILFYKMIDFFFEFRRRDSAVFESSIH